MTSNSENNKWQYFFSILLTIGLAMNAYIVNKVDSMDNRQNEYIERMKAVEMRLDYQEKKFSEVDVVIAIYNKQYQELEDLKAILREEEKNLTRKKSKQKD